MTGRKCSTCTHYEPSPLRRRGWCRNPRLFSPQQSHLVDQDELGCGSGTGSYWEPLEPEPTARASVALPAATIAATTKGTSPTVTAPRHVPDGDRDPAGMETTELDPAAHGVAGQAQGRHRRGGRWSLPRPTVRRLLPAGPSLVGAGSMLATSGGPGSGYGQPAGSGGRSERPARAGAGGVSGSGGTFGPRGGRGAGDDFDDEGDQVQYVPARSAGRPAGQERTVSYQPEERYWTDYLRIALPVVGLLLLLGLFVFWTQGLIGDDSDEEPTAPVAGEVIVQPTVPPVASPTIVITPQAGTQPAGNQAAVVPTPTGAAAGAGQETATEAPAAEETPPADTAAADEDPDAGETGVEGEFVEGDAVVVSNPEGANLRDDTSSDATLVRELAEGDALTILGGPTESSGGLSWYRVSDDQGNEGYVVDTAIDAAP
ncbi:MAG: hypothetical protein AVDCRST_MAG49-3518 [uncultured Thermomicrobiales bacterium]|uniref:SH3b domain-containing protein n=1 Tax=uncultured Thermomicrobiales bacterium TaxID=1645740 RepID=A0A6J4V656_9BACT|nr:MAG: hypothetical protein AVDCRST_MAG49-3518 [uncultured Thermomicrobiales bacterium]